MANTEKEIEDLERARGIVSSIMEMVPVKSEPFKVEDKKKLRDRVMELFQIMGEMNGVIKELRRDKIEGANINQNVAGSGTNHVANSRAATYADRLKGRETVVVRIEPKEKQTEDETKKQLVDKVDVCGKQIGILNVKKGRNGSVFVECNTKRDAEKLKTTVAEKMTANAKEVGKSNPVLCVYGIDGGLEEEKFLECLRRQNYAIEGNFKDADALKKELKVFRYFSSKRDNDFGVRNAVISVSGRVRELIVGKNINVMWRTCAVRDYQNILCCFKCLGTGHKAKDCKNAAVCGKCGGDHEKVNCTNNAVKCAVCTKKNVPGVDLKHIAYSKECVSLKKLIEFAAKRTNYNG